MTEDLGGPCNWWEIRDEDQDTITLPSIAEDDEAEGEGEEVDGMGTPAFGTSERGRTASKSRGKSRAGSSRAGSARGNFGVVRWASNELLAETLKMWDKVDPYTGIELRHLPSAATDADAAAEVGLRRVRVRVMVRVMVRGRVVVGVGIRLGQVVPRRVLVKYTPVPFTHPLYLVPRLLLTLVP